jgi:hypothetical protein
MPCLFVAQEWMRAPRQTEITIDCDLNITVTTELGQPNWNRAARRRRKALMTRKVQACCSTYAAVGVGVFVLVATAPRPTTLNTSPDTASKVTKPCPCALPNWEKTQHAYRKQTSEAAVEQ